jgi:hypothetical protein
MSQADRNPNYVEPVFHPISHYASPDAVLSDANLSTDEKRVTLSSWASDIYVVESHPARWTREANVQRYRKLLNTQLTDLERRFIERRLAEELQG